MQNRMGHHHHTSMRWANGHMIAFIEHFGKQEQNHHNECVRGARKHLQSVCGWGKWMQTEMIRFAIRYVVLFMRSAFPSTSHHRVYSRIDVFVYSTWTATNQMVIETTGRCRMCGILVNIAATKRQMEIDQAAIRVLRVGLLLPRLGDQRIVSVWRDYSEVADVEHAVS